MKKLGLYIAAELKEGDFHWYKEYKTIHRYSNKSPNNCYKKRRNMIRIENINSFLKSIKTTKNAGRVSASFKDNTLEYNRYSDGSIFNT